MRYKERLSSNTAVQGEADAMETSLSSAAHVKAFFRVYYHTILLLRGNI